jgi:hypothetical protein
MIITDTELKDHPTIDQILREYFEDYYVGTCVDWDDKNNEDYLFTKDILFTNTMFGLVVDNVVVAIAEVYSQNTGDYINIFTKQSERRNGYSYELANHLMQIGLVNAWSVSTMNVESIHLALKLGLVENHQENSYESGFRHFIKPETSHGSAIHS